jgi:L-lactate dehydrogenase (cytochrome)
VLLGRAWLYALAASGEGGVAKLLDLMAREMRVTMTLAGVRRIADISGTNLAPSS